MKLNFNMNFGDGGQRVWCELLRCWRDRGSTDHRHLGGGHTEDAATPFVTVAAVGGITIRGVVVNGANAGNLTIKHLKVTSGTSTVFINSFVKAIKRV